MRLTKAQEKMLSEAIANGSIVVNGRRMEPALALGRLRLANIETWAEDGGSGGRWQIRVRPTVKGRERRSL
jgi:hypothetical protein